MILQREDDMHSFVQAVFPSHKQEKNWKGGIDFLQMGKLSKSFQGKCHSTATFPITSFVFIEH